MIDKTQGFTLVRTFDATPEDLWQAWIDPDAISAWWHAGGATTPRDSVEVDAQVGGRYVYAMVDGSSGDRMVTGGVYLEMVPFERLVFTWGYPDADPDDSPVATVTFEADGDRTRMTFDLRGVQGAKGDGFFYDGWEAVLDTFEGYIRR